MMKHNSKFKSNFMPRYAREATDIRRNVSQLEIIMIKFWFQNVSFFSENYLHNKNLKTKLPFIIREYSYDHHI